MVRQGEFRPKNNIERIMILAIENCFDIQRSNTKVEIKPNGYVVWLYDTPILIKHFYDVYVCDGGFNTATTQSRLNALGIAYSKNRSKNKVEMTCLSKMMDILQNL